MFASYYDSKMDSLKKYISTIKRYFILSIYGQNKMFKISVIQVQSIKLMDICMQVLFLNKFVLLSQYSSK